MCTSVCVTEKEIFLFMKAEEMPDASKVGVPLGKQKAVCTWNRGDNWPAGSLQVPRESVGLLSGIAYLRIRTSELSSREWHNLYL